MRRKSKKQDEKFERRMAEIFKARFSEFLTEIERNGLKVEAEMGINLENEFEPELEEEFVRRTDRRFENKIINEIREFFSKIIEDEKEPFRVVDYFIKRHEGAIQKLKYSGSIRIMIPKDLECIIPDLDIFMAAYIEILKRVIQRVKFEYEII